MAKWYNCYWNLTVVIPHYRPQFNDIDLFYFLEWYINMKKWIIIFYGSNILYYYMNVKKHINIVW